MTGCDPNTTKSGRIPIGTGYIKTKAENGVPILIKINEAPINSQSKVTLLAEHQIRCHGFIVDSVATKHKINSKGDRVTQRLTLNEDVWIPFVDRGGIMGFEMLPIEEGDLDEVDPPFDVFELTSDKRWIPARHRAATVSTDDST